MLLIALASILYGSVMAFTTTDARLILGYSSVAQLGFITLGIFSLQRRRARRARCCRRSTTGSWSRRAFFIVALLAARAGGSEDLRDMGGIAFRAPVLATLFLIVALATLAMPGSSNFVGEFLILLGVFNAKIVDRDRRLHRRGAGQRLHAAAVHPRDAQPRRAARRVARDRRSRDGLVLVPLVAVILALALYPAAGAASQRSDGDVAARRRRRGSRAASAGERA